MGAAHLQGIRARASALFYNGSLDKRRCAGSLLRRVSELFQNGCCCFVSRLYAITTAQGGEDRAFGIRRTNAAGELFFHYTEWDGVETRLQIVSICSRTTVRLRSGVQDSLSAHHQRITDRGRGCHRQSLWVLG